MTMPIKPWKLAGNDKITNKVGQGNVFQKEKERILSYRE